MTDLPFDNLAGTHLNEPIEQTTIAPSILADYEAEQEERARNARLIDALKLVAGEDEQSRERAKRIAQEIVRALGIDPPQTVAAPIQLYQFQLQIIGELAGLIAAGFRRILITVPTAGGKTIVANEIKRRLSASKLKTAFYAHTGELVTQTRDGARDMGMVDSIIKAGMEDAIRPQALHSIATVQTVHSRVIRRQTMELENVALVFIDEGHRSVAKTYRDIIRAYGEDVVIVGLTATPCRSDKRGLGDVYQKLIVGPQVNELIDLGLLVKARIYRPDEAIDLKGVTVTAGDYQNDKLSKRMNTPKLVGDIVTHWLKIAERRKTIVFAVDVAHSVDICKRFVDSGVKAIHLDGSTPQHERDLALRTFRDGEIEVLCNCGLFLEGFNVPDIGCLVLARPTKSFGLFKQIIGRALRAAPGKKDAIILDHSDNIRRHGLPTDDVHWALAENQKADIPDHAERVEKAGGEKKDAFDHCPRCEAVKLRGRECNACGWEPAKRAQTVGVIEGDLVEMGASPQVSRRQEQQQFYRELCGYGRTARKKDGTPYKMPGWAKMKYQEKYGQGVWPDRAWDHLAPLSPSDATRGWLKHRQIAWAKAHGR